MLLAAAIAAGGASVQESAAVKELIPTGRLRVGIVFAPAASAFFVVKDAHGEPHGVTVDLARELAKQLGVPLEFMLSDSCPSTRSARSASTSGRPIS
jgi:polar amino acid transport system substrate-binding protein